MLQDINKQFLFFILFYNIFSQTTVENKTEIETYKIKFLSSEDLKKINLFYGKEGFYVTNEDKKINIEKYNLDPELKDITTEQLKLLLENGYITLKQIAGDEFILRVNIKGLGGGPILGQVFGWLTRIVGYGVIGVAAREADPEVYKTVSDVRGMDRMIRNDLRGIANSKASSLVADKIRQHPEGIKYSKEATSTLLMMGQGVLPIEIAAKGFEALGTLLPTP